MLLSVKVSRTLCYILIVSYLATSSPAAAQYLTGAVLDEQIYRHVPKVPPLARGDYDSLPSQVSLKHFAPTPGNQGGQGSCVGWATAYAARTLAEATRFEMGDKRSIDQTRFSPSFIFNQIKLGSCDEGGSLPTDALALMESVGVPLLSDFPYTDTECHSAPSDDVIRKAANYKIKGFQRLFPYDSSAKHISVRRSLANGHPVVIGMLISHDFSRVRGVYDGTDKDYAALKADKLGGHAMTVVGYDDHKHGGAFEIMNSWGTGWGENGYTWLTYEAFNTYVVQGYEMIPPDPPRPPAVVDMGGEIRFKHISGREMPGSKIGTGFSLASPYPSGTRFRVEIKAEHSAYLYALGGDLSGKFVELFPRSRGVSPHVDGGSTLLMPGPSEDFYTRLNDDTGTDFYVVLYSREMLDIDDITDRMSSSSGNVHAKLRAALGETMVEQDNVEYGANGMKFEAKSDGRLVAPIVVAIEHVAPSSNIRDRDPPKLVVSEPAADDLEEIVANNPVRRVTSPVFHLRGVAQDEGTIQSVSISGASASRFSSRGPFEAEIEVPDDGNVHPVTIVAVDADGNRSESTLEVVVSP